MDQRNKLTEAELEILRQLWKHGSRTVRQVNEALNLEREVGYTTTLKMMQLMTEKGLLDRNTDQRTHIYSAAVEQQMAQKNLLQTFVKNAFGGSASRLVMQALGQSSPTAEELDEIKALIEKIENRQGHD